MEPSVPFWLVVAILGVVAPAALADSDAGPSGGAIDGAGGARDLDEGFDGHRGGVVVIR